MLNSSSSKVDSDLSNNHPIFSMCKTGDVVGVKHFLANDTANQLLNSKDSHGNSLLYYACLCGRITLVKYLSDLGLRDDEYRRCYWNSLSMQTRSILKLYNDYKSLPNGSGSVMESSNSEIGVISIMHKYVMKCIHNSSSTAMNTTNDVGQSSDFVDTTESIIGSGEDMILKFNFKDQKAEYKCHNWIILSRWPQLLLFVASALDKIIVDPPFDFFSIIDPSEMVLSKMSNQEFETHVKNCNTGLDPKLLNKKLRTEKNKHKELKSKYKMLTNISGMEDCREALSTKDVQLINSKLSKIIDFGFIKARKEHFDMVLIFLYTGKVVSTQNYDIICMLEIGVMLKMKVLVDHLVDIIIHKSNVKSPVEQVLTDLDPINYLSKDNEKLSKIDLLKKTSCGMGITLATGSNISVKTPLVCHKSIALDRCEFFHVISTCQFEEGLKFKTQESNHELPIIELQQFSSESTLQDLLRYIYCEKVDITKNNVVELMNTSDLYGFSSLANKCEQYLCENTTSTDGNLWELYKLSISLEKKRWQKSLEQKTLDFVMKECRLGRLKQEEIISELESLDINPDLIQRFRNASKVV